jgi:hypothetical protein
MTRRLETLEHHALNFDQPEILGHPSLRRLPLLWWSPLIVAVTPYCSGHPLLWRSPLIVAVTLHCGGHPSLRQPRPIVMTLRQQPPHFDGITTQELQVTHLLWWHFTP